MASPGASGCGQPPGSTVAHEHDRIRAAIDRILNEEPQHSNGALTVFALSQEAQLPRNARLLKGTPIAKTGFTSGFANAKRFQKASSASEQSSPSFRIFETRKLMNSSN
jgi:hypothetical protein